MVYYSAFIPYYSVLYTVHTKKTSLKQAKRIRTDIVTKLFPIAGFQCHAIQNRSK